MALLVKAVAEPGDEAFGATGITRWDLYVAQPELTALSQGVATGFEVQLPKDVTVAAGLMKITLRLMPGELADRHAIVQEFQGQPDVIAAKVKDASALRLRELHAILGDDGVFDALPNLGKGKAKV